MNLFTRIRQFWRARQAQPLNPLEIAYLQKTLNPAQQALFLALPIYEKRHALNVCQTLVRAGFGADRELLQAALLHDLGKRDPTTGHVIPIWVKVANVVLGRKVVEGLAQQRATGWQYLFWLQITHEQRGADLARAAGSDGRVVALVGGEGDRAGRFLKWADDLN